MRQRQWAFRASGRWNIDGSMDGWSGGWLERRRSMRGRTADAATSGAGLPAARVDSCAPGTRDRAWSPKKAPGIRGHGRRGNARPRPVGSRWPLREPTRGEPGKSSDAASCEPRRRITAKGQGLRSGTTLLRRCALDALFFSLAHLSRRAHITDRHVVDASFAEPCDARSALVERGLLHSAPPRHRRRLAARACARNRRTTVEGR